MAHSSRNIENGRKRIILGNNPNSSKPFDCSGFSHLLRRSRGSLDSQILTNHELGEPEHLDNGDTRVIRFSGVQLEEGGGTRKRGTTTDLRVAEAKGEFQAAKSAELSDILLTLLMGKR